MTGPTPRRRRGKLALDRVIGLTTGGNGALAAHPSSSEVAYPAGAVVVVYNTATHRQVRFLVADKEKQHRAFACVAYSPSGQFLAAGESGHNPHVVVWDAETGQQLAALAGHKFGISSVSFGPSESTLVSVGFQHDGLVRVWAWRTGQLLAMEKSVVRVHAAVHLSASVFYTGGQRHIKVWTPAGKSFEARAAALGAHRDQTFVDMAVSAGGVLMAVTAKALLCSFSEQHALHKWVELKAERAFAISTSADGLVACACSKGVVRIFRQESFEYVGTLPKPPPLFDDEPGSAFPDAVACRFLTGGKQILCVYSDRSLMVWDIADPKSASLVRAVRSHSSCVWGVALPHRHPVAPPEGIPANAFATCSADGSVRLWDMDGRCLRVIASDPSADEPASSVKGEAPDGGLRCVAFSPDGVHMVTGDRVGNIRVYDTATWECKDFLEAHDGEVLSIDFSRSVGDGGCVMATASRDRLIHIFEANASGSYTLLQTIDDHSGSITAVRFAGRGKRLVSSAADKSVAFRTVRESGKVTRDTRAVVPYGTIYDLDVDVTGKYAVTSGQDKKINVFSLKSGKSVRSFKPDVDVGDVVKVKLDPAGLYVATSTSDRCVRLFDFSSGDCISRSAGHSELVTGVVFSNDGSRLVSASGDGCVFVWRVSSDLVRAITERTAQLGIPAPVPVSVRHTPAAPASTATTPTRHQRLQQHHHSPIKGTPPPTHTTATATATAAEADGDAAMVPASAVSPTVMPKPGALDPAKEVELARQKEDLASLLPGFRFSETGLPAWAATTGPDGAAAGQARAQGGDKPPRGAPAGDAAKGRWAQRADASLVANLSRAPVIATSVDQPEGQSLTARAAAVAAGAAAGSPNADESDEPASFDLFKDNFGSLSTPGGSTRKSTTRLSISGKFWEGRSVGDLIEVASSAEAAEEEEPTKEAAEDAGERTPRKEVGGERTPRKEAAEDGGERTPLKEKNRGAEPGSPAAPSKEDEATVVAGEVADEEVNVAMSAGPSPAPSPAAPAKPASRIPSPTADTKSVASRIASPPSSRLRAPKSSPARQLQMSPIPDDTPKTAEQLRPRQQPVQMSPIPVDTAEQLRPRQQPLQSSPIPTVTPKIGKAPRAQDEVAATKPKAAPIRQSRLSRRPEDYRNAIKELRGALDSVLALYDEARDAEQSRIMSASQDTTIHMGGADQDEEEEEDHKIFKELHETLSGAGKRLAEVVPSADPAASTMSSAGWMQQSMASSMASVDVNLALERYSDMLVGMVQKKLKL